MKTTSSRNLDAAHSLVALAHCMDHQNQNSHFHRQYTPRIIIPVHGTSQLMPNYHDRNSPTSTGSSVYSSNWTSDQSSNGIGLVSSPSSSSKSPTSPICPSFPSTSSSNVPSKQTILTFQGANNKTQVIFGASPFISHPSLLVSNNNSILGTIQGDNNTVKSSSHLRQNDEIMPPSPSLILDNDGSLFMVARILADLKSVKQDHPNGSPAPSLPPCSSPSMTSPTSTTGDHDQFSHRRTFNGGSPRSTRVPKGCCNRYVCSYPGCGKMYGKYLTIYTKNLIYQLIRHTRALNLLPNSSRNPPPYINVCDWPPTLFSFSFNR